MTDRPTLDKFRYCFQLLRLYTIRRDDKMSKNGQNPGFHDGNSAVLALLPAESSRPPVMFLCFGGVFPLDGFYVSISMMSSPHALNLFMCRSGLREHLTITPSLPTTRLVSLTSGGRGRWVFPSGELGCVRVCVCIYKKSVVLHKP